MTSTDSADSQSSGSSDQRDSGMSIEFALSIRYNRIRPDTRGDRVEARIDSVALIVIGSLVTLVILIFLVPRILAALP